MQAKIALTALGLAALAAVVPAQAQSNVTLYGIMDLGYARIDNAASSGSGLNLLRSGNLYTSRIGFRGVEDLGSGLKAKFQLEAGLAADTGATSTPFFNRQSWVSLGSDSFGDVALGRMFPVVADVFLQSLPATHFGNPAAAIDGAAVGAGSSAARFNNMLGGTRVDNTLKYTSPSLAGFKGHGMVSFGEVSGSNSAGRMLSLGGSYNSENLEGALVYHEKQCATAAGCDGATSAKDRIWALGGAYKVSGMRYAAIYTRERNALNVRGADADVLDLIVRIPFASVWSAGAGIQFLNDKTAANQDVRQYNLVLNYLLSKRTQVYALYAHQSVKNGGKAGMYSVTASGGTQNQLSIGLAHSF